MTVLRHPVRKSTLALAAMVALGALPAMEAQGAICIWNPSSGNWATAGNWSCGVVPTGPGSDTATIGASKTVTVNTAQSIFSLVNSGTINIDAFLLALQSGGSTTNSGTINIGGPSTATLQITNDINNVCGVINIANGSGLNQFSNTITGGTINTTGTGALFAFNSSSNALSGVTLNGVLDALTPANSRERIGNGMTLNGSVNIGNGGIVSLDSSLGAANSIGGTGTFNLNDAGARLAIDGNGTTTLGANITVRGQGNIGTPINVVGNNVLTNNGLISADVFGGTLTIVPPASGGASSMANNGTLRAINGATLVLSANVANTGLITAQAGSNVVQSGITISGGTLSTSGTGLLQMTNSANNFLDNVTFTGVLDMTTVPNSRERIVNAAPINGSINIANGGILTLDSANTAGGNQTLSGNVTVNLNDAGARLAIDGNGTTTLASTVTVRGQGNIGTPLFTTGNNVLTNNGLISADVASGTLEIVAPGSGSSSFVNNGTLQAINGGTLRLSTNILSNPGSQIVAGAGSAVFQNGVRLNGIVTASGGSFTMSNSANNFLDNVTFTGVLDMTTVPNSRERIVNAAPINGSINIANGGILTLDSANTAGGNQTLSGNVTVNLNDAGARLAIDGNGTTTLASTVTVRGQGNIGTPLFTTGNNVLTNNGLISADVASGTLEIVAPGSGSSSFVNNGTLQAINGGTLRLSTNILSNPGSQIVAGAGSAVFQNGVRLNGIVTASGGSFTMSNSANNFLDNVTFTGVLDMTTVPNSRERIVNAAPINGSINIANGGILTLDSANTAGGNQTLSGNVTVNLNDAGARLAIDGNGTTTLASTVTVR